MPGQVWFGRPGLTRAEWLSALVPVRNGLYRAIDGSMVDEYFVWRVATVERDEGVPLAEAQRRQHEHEQEARRAAERAHEMFVSLLDDENRDRYGREGRIFITGSQGNRYEILHGSSGNVYLLNELGRGVRRFCGHPRMGRGLDRLPTEAAMIAQMLLLQTDESEFLRIAYVV